jgi:hypothetical protein
MINAGKGDLLLGAEVSAQSAEPLAQTQGETRSAAN